VKRHEGPAKQLVDRRGGQSYKLPGREGEGTGRALREQPKRATANLWTHPLPDEHV